MRPPAARLTAVTAAALAAMGLAACGSSSGGGPGAQTGFDGTQTVGGTTAAASGAGRIRRLQISPAHPKPSSAIRFGYVAPAATGARHGNRTSYSLSITGPARGGCVGVHEASGPSAGAGAHATITVGPAQLGKSWCAGLYTARVLELQAPVCAAGTPCPQYIRVVGTVARGRFAIAAR
jgi:hypothetical protein